MALYHMWAIAFGSPEAFFYRGTHLMFAMVLVFLLYPLPLQDRRRGADRSRRASAGRAEDDPNADVVRLRAAGARHRCRSCTSSINYEYITTRIFYVDDLTPTDMIMGTIMVADACWRRRAA